MPNLLTPEQIINGLQPDDSVEARKVQDINRERKLLDLKKDHSAVVAAASVLAALRYPENFNARDSLLDGLKALETGEPINVYAHTTICGQLVKIFVGKDFVDKEYVEVGKEYQNIIHGAPKQPKVKPSLLEVFRKNCKNLTPEESEVVLQYRREYATQKKIEQKLAEGENPSTDDVINWLNQQEEDRKARMRNWAANNKERLNAKARQRYKEKKALQPSKTPEEIAAFQASRRKKRNEYMKEYRAKNADKFYAAQKAYNKNWREKNKERIKENRRKRYIKMKEEKENA